MTVPVLNLTFVVRVVYNCVMIIRISRGSCASKRLLTGFSSPRLLLQGHQQGGKNQFNPVGAQVPHHSFGTVICSLVEEKEGMKTQGRDTTTVSPIRCYVHIVTF